MNTFFIASVIIFILILIYFMLSRSWYNEYFAGDWIATQQFLDATGIQSYIMSVNEKNVTAILDNGCENEINLEIISNFPWISTIYLSDDSLIELDPKKGTLLWIDKEKNVIAEMIKFA